MFEYQFGNEKLIIGRQNFITMNVPVEVEGVTTSCTMFHDYDGDIGFLYKGERIYFRYVDKK
ncbi:hypothetical protein [Priestia megaterium]|uniref:hypothetical protein n=1 Tax=Priestia megaterium TaxID=1404 RepID=UPI00112C0E45|nr:hypothetical protein [Priestia megaterium]TPF17972.1 hypothetical protein CBE78_01740 [Priestia megaterium]TPF22080.1 hypothetical protein CBE79_04245 [Priestia megaterium]